MWKTWLYHAKHEAKLCTFANGKDDEQYQAMLDQGWVDDKAKLNEGKQPEVPLPNDPDQAQANDATPPTYEYPNFIRELLEKCRKEIDELWDKVSELESQISNAPNFDSKREIVQFPHYQASEEEPEAYETRQEPGAELETEPVPENTEPDEAMARDTIEQIFAVDPESLNEDELIELATSYGLKANKRHAESTIIGMIKDHQRLVKLSDQFGTESETIDRGELEELAIFHGMDAESVENQDDEELADFIAGDREANSEGQE